MASFLITYKPSTENSQKGWPLAALKQVVARYQAYGHLIEEWRFANRSQPVEGDRVFLLIQGKRGPAILGYGSVRGLPKQIGKTWYRPVQFQLIVDPDSHVLATREELQSINESSYVWKAEASGTILPTHVAQALEQLVVGRDPLPVVQRPLKNPPWTTDELILALNLYFEAGRRWLDDTDPRVIKLSQELKMLRTKDPVVGTFRNAAGVSMKLGNFLRLDPQYTGKGRVGLKRGGKLERVIWDQFAEDPMRLAAVASAIKSLLGREASSSDRDSLELEGMEAAEGRILTRTHLIRERNRAIVEKRKRKALREFGRLVCEACDFDFAKKYGRRGEGFIECHHTKPLHTLPGSSKTRLEDLTLVCSNCHRMIHSESPWLSIAELRLILKPNS